MAFSRFVGTTSIALGSRLFARNPRIKSRIKSGGALGRDTSVCAGRGVDHFGPNEANARTVDAFNDPSRGSIRNASSPMLKFRRPLPDESGHSFLLVLRRKQGMEGARLKPRALGQRHLLAVHDSCGYLDFARPGMQSRLAWPKAFDSHHARSPAFRRHRQPHRRGRGGRATGERGQGARRECARCRGHPHRCADRRRRPPAHPDNRRRRRHDPRRPRACGRASCDIQAARRGPSRHQHAGVPGRGFAVDRRGGAPRDHHAAQRTSRTPGRLRWTAARKQL